MRMGKPLSYGEFKQAVSNEEQVWQVYTEYGESRPRENGPVLVVDVDSEWYESVDGGVLNGRGLKDTDPAESDLAGKGRSKIHEVLK